MHLSAAITRSSIDVCCVMPCGPFVAFDSSPEADELLLAADGGAVVDKWTPVKIPQDKPATDKAPAKTAKTAKSTD